MLKLFFWLSRQHQYQVDVQMMKTADIPCDDFLVEVRRCVKKKNWKQILQLSKKYGPDVTAEYLWVFPTEKCLLSLRSFAKASFIRSVLSIGCGHGLLEFVIKESIGLEVSAPRTADSLARYSF